MVDLGPILSGLCHKLELLLAKAIKKIVFEEPLLKTA
jgi:hypothetical protein